MANSDFVIFPDRKKKKKNKGEKYTEIILEKVIFL